MEKDLLDKVKELLLEVSEKAYGEGRNHERLSTSPHLKQAYHVHGKDIPRSFKDTEIYKEIKENWK